MSDAASYSVRDGIAVITMNNPPVNGLGSVLRPGIMDGIRKAGADPAVKALVIIGTAKAFSGGADIREFNTPKMNVPPSLPEINDAQDACAKPMIAAIGGFALGGGCELALACHLRIAADTARLGQPEVGLGLIPGAGGTQRLPRLVGSGRALDLILSGDAIDAAEALRIGLVERVVPAAELRAAVTTYAEKLLSRSGIALARALEAVLTGGGMALPDALRLEASLFGLGFATEDMREGTRAFLEKRKPRFAGR